MLPSADDVRAQVIAENTTFISTNSQSSDPYNILCSFFLVVAICFLTNRAPLINRYLDVESKKTALIVCYVQINASLAICFLCIPALYGRTGIVFIFSTPALVLLHGSLAFYNGRRVCVPIVTNFDYLLSFLPFLITFLSTPFLCSALFYFYPPTQCHVSSLSGTILIVLFFTLYAAIFTQTNVKMWQLLSSEKLTIVKNGKTIGHLVAKGDIWVKFDLPEDL